jgi:hypothetical protein
MPGFGIGEIEDNCAEASLWTSTDLEQQKSSPETISNVILVMIDGVRWQEIAELQSQPEPLFSYLRSTLLASGAHLFVNDHVANPYRVSLPAYQSIFAGKLQNCANNSCGRILTETFPERLVRELALDPKKVATLASWNRIACAVESTPRATFVNAGNGPGHISAYRKAGDFRSLAGLPNIVTWISDQPLRPLWDSSL